jgi:uncharacterized RDD family membrane protein YckC
MPYTAPLAYADNGSRFAAYLVDGLIIGAASFVVYLPFASGSSDAQAFVLFLIVAFAVGYYTFFHSRSGQTPGKRMAGIKVVRKDGSPLTAGRAFWRAIAYLVIPAVLAQLTCGLSGLVYFLPLFDGERRALHDFLSDTRVIKV